MLENNGVQPAIVFIPKILPVNLILSTIIYCVYSYAHTDTDKRGTGESPTFCRITSSLSPKSHLSSGSLSKTLPG